MRGLTSMVLAAVILATNVSYGQLPTTDPFAGANPIGPAGRPLEDLLKEIIATHPDVQVAEAKIREGEAELKRIRLNLAQRLLELYATVESHRKVTQASQAEYDMYRKLFQTKAGSESDWRRAYAQFERSKSDLVQAEASLNGLIGAIPGPAGAVIRNADSGARAPGAVASATTGAIARRTSLGPTGPLSQKLRKALDAPLRLKELENTPVADVMKQIQAAIPEVPLLLHLGGAAREKVSLSLASEVPLGAALQALEDVVPGLKLYVREYGILVTFDVGPSDGMTLVEFWRNK